MDLYCTTCGEPHEIESLQEPEEYGLTVKGHMIVACGSCEFHRKHGTIDTGTAKTAASMHEILGDDIDGIASMMEDMGY